MNPPQVSVIVPVYNVEEYLADCLQSVLSQQGIELEVVIINDGATDGSLEIAQKFAESDARVKLFSFENGGLSIARNRGIEKATGQYIQFLDSDDMLPVDSLKNAVAIIESKQLDMLLGSSDVLQDHKMPLENIPHSDYDRPVEVLDKVKSGQEIFADLVETTFHPSACLYLVKTELIKEFSFFPNILHEDNLFTTSLMLSAKLKKVMVSDIKLYSRRIRPGSIMTSAKSVKHILGFWITFKKLNIIQKGRYSKRVKSAISKFANHLLAETSLSANSVYKKTSIDFWSWRAKMIVFAISRISILFSPKALLKVVLPELYLVLIKQKNKH
ncbi:MAG: glycosyltransferase involved in cell wall biosynthesis [Psychromonas sp.]|jgi:glycosyltransferase involved in cell wall biosynthesis|uniref:glycosyltransferase family 2 protein n=1 Tax=Psychromonas sp. TaxID=1884585 RepID=UPI0039E2CBB4